MRTFLLSPRSLIIFGGLGLSVNSFALSVQHDFNLPLSTTDWSHTVELDRFDSSLGTLTSVEFYISANLTSDISLLNMSRSSSSRFVVSSGARIQAKDLESSSIFWDRTIETASLDKTYNKNPSGQLLYNGNFGDKFLNQMNGADLEMMTSDPTALAYVTGNSKLKFQISAKDVSSIWTSSGNVLAGVATKAAAFGYIKYNYAPQAVPEPMSVAALSAGALTVLRRKRNRK